MAELLKLRRSPVESWHAQLCCPDCGTGWLVTGRGQHVLSVARVQPQGEETEQDGEAASQPAEVVDQDAVSAEEAAAWLKVERHTIYALIRQGKLPAMRVGRGWRIYRPDLLTLRQGANKKEVRR